MHQQTINLIDSLGSGTTAATTTLRWAAANDDRDLYIALEWDDAVKNSFDPSTGLNASSSVVDAVDPLKFFPSSPFTFGKQ